MLLLTAAFFLTSCQNVIKRETIDLNGEWKFIYDSSNTGEKECWFNGLPGPKTSVVTVPHTWNINSNKLWGKGWYERNVILPAEYKNKLIRLQFDAVYHDAVVYVNGQKAGEHRGAGYTRFYVDASEFMNAGRMNKIVVLADNSKSRSNIPFLNSYDWANDGGIIRDVKIVVTEKTAIGNIQVYGEPILTKANEGIAHVKIRILNESKTDCSDMRLTADISGVKSGDKIWNGDLPAVTDNTCEAAIPVTTIQWWHFDRPELYSVKIKLFVNDQEYDSLVVRTGFRSISATKTHFVLNGEPIRIMGLEWMPGSTLEHGMAETHDDLEKNLEFMKEVNCIYTRFHWQQDEFVFNWCDEHGMLIQEEIPYWGGITMINDTMLQLGKKHLGEMVSDHFNHPSIITWGIGNELASQDSINIRSLKILYDYAKALDSSRLVNYVSNRVHGSVNGPGKSNRDATEIGDVMMFNEYYSTWYGKSVDVVSSELDRIHSEYPDKALVISEWGLCEPAHKGGDPRRIREMKQQKAIYDSKAYIPGAIYFCLNDYRTHMGEDFTVRYPQRVHGVYNISGEPKESAHVLRDISSPLVLSGITMGKTGKIQFAVMGNTGLPSYLAKNYTYAVIESDAETVGLTGIQLPDIYPGQTVGIITQEQYKRGLRLIVMRPTNDVIIDRTIE